MFLIFVLLTMTGWKLHHKLGLLVFKLDRLNDKISPFILYLRGLNLNVPYEQDGHKKFVFPQSLKSLPQRLHRFHFLCKKTACFRAFGISAKVC